MPRKRYSPERLPRSAIVTNSSSGQPARRRLHPLRVHLSAVIALVLISVAAPLIWLSHERGRDAAALAASEQMNTLTDRIVDRYRALFAEARLSVGILSAMDGFLTPPSGRAPRQAAVLLEALSLSAHLDGIYAGYPDGSFIHAVNLETNAAWREELDAPGWARYAVRITGGGDGPARRSQWRFRDAAQEREWAAPIRETDYDPRVRPWYRLAIEAGGPAVTAPYVTATTKAYALTVSEPHRDDWAVVIGADVLLDRLSRFLGEEKISPSAISYVFDRTGRLVVHSDPQVMTQVLRGLAGGPDVEDVALAARDPIYRSVRSAAQSVGEVPLDAGIEIDRRHYLVHIVRIDGDTLVDGSTIAVAAPLADFTATSERLLRHNLLVSVLLLAVGVAIAVLTARLLSRSLARLTGEANRLAAFDFTVPDPLKTRISEISVLDRAIDHAREAIRAFSLYVPRELVRRIVQSGQHEARSAVRQDVTVMFTDIRDFTTLSEKNDPEAVVVLLSRYFEVVNRCVERNHGTIVTFLGDSVYAMWNAPVADPNHAADACLCALDVAASLAGLNESLGRDGGPELVTRFGIHSGPAVVGSVGAEDRLQYTAMGDTVNVASRLEGLNKEFDTTILATRAVLERCAGRLAFRPLGFTPVKGREEAVEVFELVGPT